MGEAQIINLASNGGAFGLAVFLVVYVMRESSKREERLTGLLKEYADQIGKLTTSVQLIERRIPDGMGRPRRE